MQRILITGGLTLLIIGLAWPLLGKIPFGHLPGDIIIDRPGLKIYVPITTCLLVSIAGSGIYWLVSKIMGN